MSRMFFLLYLILAEIMEVFPSSSLKSSFQRLNLLPKALGTSIVQKRLHIYAPLSHGKPQPLNNIQSIIYSYAVTMLGRISHCSTQVMNQDTLLAYLSYCSRSTEANPIDFVKMVEDVLPTEINAQRSQSCKSKSCNCCKWSKSM